MAAKTVAGVKGTERGRTPIASNTTRVVHLRCRGLRYALQTRMRVSLQNPCL